MDATTTSLVAELGEILAAYGIDTTDVQRRLLVRHLLLVIDKNRTLNLTRISDPHDALVLHILDSLLLLDAFGQAPTGPYIDVGTGAGYPGIPLAIASKRDGILVDSVGKKTDAVSSFVEKLGLSGQVSCRHARVEDLARDMPGRFAVVVARAVAQANVLVEYAAPLLMLGGRLVMAKANVGDGEMLAGDEAAKLCGMRRVSRETYELPRGMGHREVISYERAGKPRVRLPRKAGMAKRSPLGA